MIVSIRTAVVPAVVFIIGEPSIVSFEFIFCSFNIRDDDNDDIDESDGYDGYDE